MKNILPLCAAFLLLSSCVDVDLDSEPPVLNQLLVNGQAYDGSLLVVSIENGFTFTPIASHDSRDELLLQIEMIPIYEGDVVDDEYPHQLGWEPNHYRFNVNDPDISTSGSNILDERGLVRVKARAATEGLVSGSPGSDYSEDVELTMLVVNPNLVDVYIDSFCGQSATAQTVQLSADEQITLSGNIAFEAGLTAIEIRFQDMDASTTTWYGNQSIDLSGQTSFDLGTLQADFPEEFESGDRVHFEFQGEGDYSAYYYSRIIEIQ